MNPRRCLILTAIAQFGPIAFAQTAPQLPEKAAPTPRTTIAAAPDVLQPWRAPVYDADANGVLYAAAPTYKAEFRADQVVFLPFLGSDLPHNLPVAFATARVTLGGEPLALADAVANRSGDTVRYERGALREEYHVRLSGIEQTFVFDTLPQRGELAFAIDVQSELQPTSDGDGLAFTHPRGSVGYTQAIAIDAVGRRLPLATTYADGTIRFAVPAAFVATATLPLLVDPVVGTRYQGAALNHTINGKDLAYDESAGEWHVAYAYDFSSSDSDLLVQRFDDDFVPVGNAITIDTTTTSWRQPSIANLAVYDKFLVTSRTWISTTTAVRARITAAGSAFAAGLQFEVEGPNASGNLGRPVYTCDVGGDPTASFPTYWTVVFESYNGVDYDVHLRQVREDGTLRGNAPTAVAATSADETQPCISKCNGQGDFASQAWAIVYNHDYYTLRGRSVTWNGSMVAPSQQLVNGITSHNDFAISSPTDAADGTRYFLLTYDAPDATQTSVDIHGVLTNRSMLPVGVSTSLTALALTSTQNALSQGDPSVDCDGARFVVGFTHHFSANDRDARAATFQRQPSLPGALVAVESSTVAAASYHEDTVAVCARRSGAGGRVEYGLAWQAEVTAASDRVEAVRYHGRQSGVTVTTRATGCGSLGIGSTGAPYAGEVFTVTRSGGQGLGGFVVGYPATIPLGNCPGCTLGVSGTTQLSATVPVTIPTVAAFLGLTLSFQAFDLGIGPCLSQVSLSDTLDATIR